jgi:hypothetical protein
MLKLSSYLYSNGLSICYMDMTNLLFNDGLAAAQVIGLISGQLKDL